MTSVTTSHHLDAGDVRHRAALGHVISALVEEMINDADFKHTGAVDFEEFKRMMLASSEKRKLEAKAHEAMAPKGTVASANAAEAPKAEVLKAAEAKKAAPVNGVTVQAEKREEPAVPLSKRFMRVHA